MASIARRPDGQWRARYRDAAGKEHSKHFARKTDAQRWLDEVTAAVVTGQYVDPRSGRVTFREYAELWRSAQVHRPSTQEHVEERLRRHVYPVLGDRPLSSIRPSHIQAWVKSLTEQLAPQHSRRGAQDRLQHLPRRCTGQGDCLQPMRRDQAAEGDEASQRRRCVRSHCRPW
jgi:hypothetical protein